MIYFNFILTFQCMIALRSLFGQLRIASQLSFVSCFITSSSFFFFFFTIITSILNYLEVHMWCINLRFCCMPRVLLKSSCLYRSSIIYLGIYNTNKFDSKIDFLIYDLISIWQLRGRRVYRICQPFVIISSLDMR